MVDPESTELEPKGLANPPTAFALGALLFHVGFFTLAAQSLLVREFLVLYGGSEAALGIFYAAWLFWIAAGALLFLRVSRWRVGSGESLALLLGMLPVAAILEVALLRWGRAWMGATAAEVAPLGPLALATFGATACIGLPAGLAFSAACRASERWEADRKAAGAARGSVGLLFGFEALGGFAGGLTHTFLLAERASTEATLALLMALVGGHLLAWAWLARFGKPWRWRAVAIAFLALGLGATCSPWGREILGALRRNSFERRWPGLKWVAGADSRYGRFALVRRGDQFTLFANGQVAFSFPDALDNRRRAALAMAQCPRGARRILVLGSAESELLEELLRYASVERIDAVALDPRVAELVAPYLSPSARAARSDPRVRLLEDDPRAFANREPQSGASAYDLAFIVAPDPTSANVNRLFTLEFVECLARHMAPDGVVVAEVQSSANYLGTEVADYAATLVATFRKALAEVALTPGDRMTILACRGRGIVSVDAEILAERYAQMRPPASPFRPDAFTTMLPPRDVEAVAKRFSRLPERINTDARPMAYYLATRVWSRFAGSSLPRGLLGALEERGVGLLLLPLAVFWLVRLLYVWRTPDRSVERFNAVATVGGLGCLAMMASLLFVLAYQCSVGLLYGRIGLLAALFMVGLGGGALFGALLPFASLRSSRLTLMGVLGIVGVLFVAMGRLLPGGAGHPGALAMLGLGAAGALVGLGFAASARVHGDLPTRAGAWLDAADHAGGAVGGLLTGSVAVPLLGFAATAWLGAAVTLGLLALHAQALVRKPIAASVPSRDRFRPWGWCLGALALSAYGLGFWLDSGAETKREALRVPRTWLAEWSREEGWNERAEPFRHWFLPRTDATVERVAFASDRTAPEARGYGGPLAVALEMDSKTLGHVRLLDDSETPAYIVGLDAWLARLEGKPLDAPPRLGRDVEALTGATVTCRAALDAVNLSMYRGASELLGRNLDGKAYGRDSWARSLASPAFLTILLCFVLLAPVYLFGGKRVRLGFLLFAACVMGFWLNRAFTLLDVGALSLGRWPSAANAPAAALLGGVGLTALLWGNVFCGYLCPFGALQELLAWLCGIATLGGRWVLNERMRAWRDVRFVLLAAALTAFWLTAGDRRWLAWSPLQTFFVWSKSASLWVSDGAALLASCFLTRLWCLYLCPAGAVLSLSNRLALLRNSRWMRRPAYRACDLGATADRPRNCLRCNRCLTSENEPQVPSPMRRRAIAAAFVVALGAMAVVFWQEISEPAPARAAEALRADPSASHARDIDLRAVEKALESGRLSDREALYYDQIEQEPSSE